MTDNEKLDLFEAQMGKNELYDAWTTLQSLSDKKLVEDARVDELRDRLCEMGFTIVLVPPN